MDASELVTMKEHVDKDRAPHALVWKVLQKELTVKTSATVYTGTNGQSFYNIANPQAGRARDLALAWWMTGDNKYADEAVAYLAAWSQPQPLPGSSFDASFDPNVGIYLVRGTLGFLYAADLLWDYPGFTTSIKDSFAQWLDMMRTRILACKQRWADNDYYGQQYYNNHLATHTLGLAAIGSYLGDRALVQYAIAGDDNARDYTDLLQGLILMPGDATIRREKEVDPDRADPQPYEITDRVRHYDPDGKKGLQYAHLSMNIMAQTAEIGRHLGLDLWNYQAPGGENLRGSFEYYSDFYRLGSADIKSGFYAGESDRLGRAGDTPATFELGAARFPESQPLRDLLAVTDRPLHRCHTLGPVVLTHGPAGGASESTVWDTSTAAGFQNGNGSWGAATHHFWTTTNGGGTNRAVWTSGWNSVWLGGNSTGAATPDGNFTITVVGTRTVGQVRQIANGAGDFTLNGGILSLHDGALRVDRGTMTVNSVATNIGSVFHLNAAGPGSTLILGGSNTFSTTAQIRGAAGGTVRLNNSGALGPGTNAVQFVNSAVLLDLNGLTFSGKRITISSGQTGFLGNASGTKSVWAGNVAMTGNLRAGGTGAEVEISGIISGGAGTTLESLDGGTLRLSGANTHAGLTSVRNGSTLIVGNASALGATNATTLIDSGTLDLNGYGIGSRAITLQQNDSRLVNDNTTSAAAISGPITMLTNRTNAQIGGDGNLTLGGIATPVAGLGGGFTKVGTGTLTLAGPSSYDGNTVIQAGRLVLAANGSLSFRIGAPGTNNAVSGAGTALFRGGFLINLAAASTNHGDSWTLVSGTGSTTYDSNFQVAGFTNNGGTWSLGTNGVTYQFTQSNGMLTVLNTNPYNSWASYWQSVDPRFTDTAATDDPDGDDLVNLAEYALGLNPVAASTLPPGFISSLGDTKRLAVTFRRVADPDLLYEVLACGDLDNWTLVWSSTGAENTAGPVTVQDSEPLGGQSARFMRLKVAR